MKKYVKLLTVFLALVMILQAAPISAMGDSVQEDTYTLSEPAVENTQATVTTEEIPETVENNFTVIQSIVWSSNDGDVVRKALADGGVINKNHVQIIATLAEEFSEVTLYVDGIALPSTYENQQISVDVEFLNGSHTVSVYAKNGSKVSSDTVSFTVNGDASYPTLSIQVPEGISLGETAVFSIGCNNMKDVNTVKVRLRMTKQFKVKNVNISDGVVGSYIWFGGVMEIELHVTDPDAIINGTLITFDVYAPVKLDVNENVYWTTEIAEITLKEGSSVGQSENFVNTFDTPDVSTPVTVEYTVSGWNYSVTNSRYALMVKDSDGNPAVGVSIYEIIGQKEILLGVTDDAGKLVVIFEKKGMHDVYAVDSADLTSAIYTVKAYEAVGIEDGTPYGIQYVGYVDNGKNITWMSNYNATVGAAQLKLSTSEDMADAVLYKGVSNYALYETSLSINRVNEVTLKDLVPGTVYYYQVGDGSHWSSVFSFKAKTYDGELNIAILGDLRGENMSSADLIADVIANGDVDYDFAIRAGAVTDDVVDYPALTMPLGSFFHTGLDIIHTASGSEFANSIHNRIFATKQAFQSYLYGNVYIAVINRTSSVAELNNIFGSITAEIRRNESKWQILVIRDSVYSTDPEFAGTLDELVPGKAENAGIDLVISGSESNYSRTDPIRNGEFHEKRGIVYLNCGSVNVKKPVGNSDGFAVTSDTYNALYVSLSVTNDCLTVTVYDVQPDGSASVIDQYCSEKFDCGEGEHVYTYVLTKALLICDHCGHTRPVSGYVGLLAISNYHLFYDNGDFLKEWQFSGNKAYYMDENTGVAYDGVQEINGYTYVFKDYVLVEGAWIEENGTRKLMWAGELLTNSWHTQAGVTYYFLSDGTMATGTVEISSVNDLGETVVETYIFDENGALIGKQE